jgi:hypothetical protein
MKCDSFCHVSPKPDPEREAVWRAILAPHYRVFRLYLGRSLFHNTGPNFSRSAFWL